MNLSEAKLITHRACMDGSTCAIVFVAAGGKLDNVHFTNPGHESVDEVVNDLADYEGLILIADVSISKMLATNIRFASEYVFLLDHHKSAIPLVDFNWCEIEVDNNRCGSRMLHDWLLRYNLGSKTKLNKYKELVDAVDDRDRWIHAIPESATLASLHKVIGQELFVERFIRNSSVRLSDNEQYVVELDNKRKAIIVANRKENTQVVLREVGGHRLRVGFVMASNHQSELGHDICNDPMMDCDIAVMIGPTSVSMRSSNSCPVSLADIASLNGGGGHDHAAGIGLTNLLGKELVDIVMEKLKFTT